LRDEHPGFGDAAVEAASGGRRDGGGKTRGSDDGFHPADASRRRARWTARRIVLGCFNLNGRELDSYDTQPTKSWRAISCSNMR
jgi:hypothetical protein